MNILDLWNNKVELTRWSGERKADFLYSLGKHVIWQDEAKQAVATALFKSINSIVPKRWPIGVFLFAWPSGVGKTEMVHAVAQELLWHQDRLTKINCESLAQSHTVSNLMGSPKGYVWYADASLLENTHRFYAEAVKDKTISNLVKRYPGFSVILLDEIEKAHPVVHQALLGIFDHWEATMGDGTRVDFSNSIIVMTTNMGECDIREISERPTMGFVAQDHSSDKKKAFDAALNKFSPEFRGRIDKVVHFEHLTEDDCIEILKSKVEKLNAAMEYSSIVNKATMLSLRITPTVYKYLAKQWYNKAVWARDLMRVFDIEINSALGEIIQENDWLLEYWEHSAIIVAEMKQGKVVFTLSKKNVNRIVSEVKDNVVDIFGLLK